MPSRRDSLSQRFPEDFLVDLHMFKEESAGIPKIVLGISKGEARRDLGNPWWSLGRDRSLAGDSTKGSIGFPAPKKRMAWGPSLFGCPFARKENTRGVI